MNYEQIIAEKDAKIERLTHELEQLKSLIFGSRKERFIPSQVDVLQGNLFAEMEPEVVEEPVEEQNISYTRKAPKKHQERNEIPAHLPVNEIVIEPLEDITGCVKIGEEVSETLEYTPATLVKRVTRRPKYKKADETMNIGELPSRPIDKCIKETMPEVVRIQTATEIEVRRQWQQHHTAFFSELNLVAFDSLSFQVGDRIVARVKSPKYREIFWGRTTDVSIRNQHSHFVG